jgi:hypothetical protein
MTKANDLLKDAQAVAQSVESWADLSNALFNPNDGLVTRDYPKCCRRSLIPTKSASGNHPSA